MGRNRSLVQSRIGIRPLTEGRVSQRELLGQIQDPQLYSQTPLWHLRQNLSHFSEDLSLPSMVPPIQELFLLSIEGGNKKNKLDLFSTRGRRQLGSDLLLCLYSATYTKNNKKTATEPGEVKKSVQHYPVTQWWTRDQNFRAIWSQSCEVHESPLEKPSQLGCFVSHSSGQGLFLLLHAYLSKPMWLK